MVNHRAACEAHEPSTGGWLIDSGVFDSWLSIRNRLLWIHGLQGCRKSVLASTVIEHVKVKCENMGAYYVVYFYFDFRQENKQTVQGILRSMITQLSSKAPDFPEEVLQLCPHDDHDMQQTPVFSLTDVLLTLFKRMQPIYLIVDALDECSSASSHGREALLEFLKRVQDETAIHVNVHI